MVHTLGLISKLRILIFSFLTLLNGCLFQTEEAVLLNTLEKKYANIKVNKNHKQQVIASIAAIAKNKKLRDHYPLYKDLIGKIGDAHLSLDEFNSVEEEHFQIEIKIQKKAYAKIPGEVEFKEIKEIDSLAVKTWVANHGHHVSASTSHGRRYRTLKLIESRPKGLLEINKIKLMDDSFIEVEKLVKPKVTKCISGFPYDDDNYVLKVSSFWCAEGKTKRSDIFNNFKEALDREILRAEPYKKIILDLRDNNGGADDEVRYLLSHLITNKTFLYTYQYLGKDKVTDYIEPLPMTLGNKPIVALINGGCFSACEIVAGVLKDGGNRNLVGERTHGGAGDPLKVKFKNSVLTYPSCLVWRENGALYEGIGVMPTVMGEVNSLKRASLLN